MFKTEDLEKLSLDVCGRAGSLFAPDCNRRRLDIRGKIEGRRILVAGGAGSIGSATILQLLPYRPKSICVLDPNENNLVELLRTIRSGSEWNNGDVQVEPIDYGSPLACEFVARQPRFDLVLSFAALKHVRSERDDVSVLRMLEVNLLGADSFLANLRQHGHGLGGVFFVSTDKAARPASLMGASKRLMELLLWAHTDERWLGLNGAAGAAPLTQVTSARFANVAFSDGSLTSSFLHRIDKGQPLAAPGDIRRYLISPAEAGQLCLLGATVCPHKHLLVPLLDAKKHVVLFTDIAAALLSRIGFGTEWCTDPDAGRRKVGEATVSRRYPVVVTKSDTDGEKEMEEFVAPHERSVDCGLRSALAVEGGNVDFSSLEALLDLVRDSVKRGCAPSKEYITDLFRQLVPDLAHRNSGRSLDVKM